MCLKCFRNLIRVQVKYVFRLHCAAFEVSANCSLWILVLHPTLNIFHILRHFEFTRREEEKLTFLRCCRIAAFHVSDSKRTVKMIVTSVYFVTWNSTLYNRTAVGKRIRRMLQCMWAGTEYLNFCFHDERAY